MVFGVETPKGKLITCSVDAATDTNKYGIEDKFSESAKDHFIAPAWAADVHYCFDEVSGKRYREKSAPHFILGVMPSRIDDAMDRIGMADGILTGREPDPVTDFKLLSEMREQIVFQKTYLEQHPDATNAAERSQDLQTLLAPVNVQLGKILGAKVTDYESYTNDFLPKYKKAQERMREDLVYKNIIYEVGRQRARLVGAKARKPA